MPTARAPGASKTSGWISSPAPLSRLRKVGAPIINAYLDNDTRQAGMRYFPLFFLFVVVLNVGLYRSWRSLLAFIITLAVALMFAFANPPALRHRPVSHRSG